MSHHKIFHGLYNLSGIPGAISAAEKLRGIHSRAICYPSQFGFAGVDEYISGEPLSLLARCADEFDVFNFHFGYTFLGQSLQDVPLLLRRGKSLVFHFHGCDVRDSKVVLQRYKVSACSECWPMNCNANRSRLRDLAIESGRATVSTPDLLEFVPNAIWLPQAVDLDHLLKLAPKSARLEPRLGLRKSDQPLRIVHTPSASRLKGSVYVEAAVARLRERGVPIDLVMLTNLQHHQVIAALASADLVIDQLLFGSYGVAAIEAMALGKPVVCFLREDVVPHYPDLLPIFNANVDTLELVLEELYERRDELPAIGARGVTYVTTYHASAAVADRLAPLYN